MDSRLEAGLTPDVLEMRRTIHSVTATSDESDVFMVGVRPTRRALTATIVALALALSACAGAGAICETSGGTFTAGTCTLSSPERLATKEWCETHGAVYLAGANICAFGEGQ
jgi:hypothetical protein